MIIKNVYTDNITYLIDDVLRRLIANNINYLLIKHSFFTELHFDKFIYRIYSNSIFIDTAFSKDIFLDNREIRSENIIYSDMSDTLLNKKELTENLFIDLDYSELKNINIKYTKRSIKHENKMNKTHTNGKGKTIKRRNKIINNKFNY